MKIGLSENIRAFRKACAMTQEQLAEVLNVTVGAVYKWESGQSVPELGTIVELADLFDTSVDVLLGYEMKDNRLQKTVERLKAYRHEKNRDGLAEAEKALRKYPNVFTVVYGGAMLYWLFGIEDREEALLRRALKLFENAQLLLSQNDDPQISESTIDGNMADILLKLDRTDEAVERLKKSNVGGLYDARIGLALAADSKKPEEAVPFLSEALMSCVGSLVNTVVGYVNVYYSQQNYAGMREITQWGIGTLSGLKDGDIPCFLDKVNGMLLVCLAYAQLQEGKKTYRRYAIPCGRQRNWHRALMRRRTAMQARCALYRIMCRLASMMISAIREWRGLKGRWTALKVPSFPRCGRRWLENEYNQATEKRTFRTVFAQCLPWQYLPRWGKAP